MKGGGEGQWPKSRWWTNGRPAVGIRKEGARVGAQKCSAISVRALMHKALDTKFDLPLGGPSPYFAVWPDKMSYF